MVDPSPKTSRSGRPPLFSQHGVGNDRTMSTVTVPRALRTRQRADRVEATSPELEEAKPTGHADSAVGRAMTSAPTSCWNPPRRGFARNRFALRREPVAARNARLPGIAETDRRHRRTCDLRQ